MIDKNNSTSIKTNKNDSTSKKTNKKNSTSEITFSDQLYISTYTDSLKIVTLVMTKRI